MRDLPRRPGRPDPAARPGFTKRTSSHPTRRRTGLSAQTNLAKANIDSASNPPIRQNSPRQPIIGSSHCTGQLEATMPSEPLVSIQELARSWAPGEKLRRNAVSGAIRHALTAAPTKPRASASAANCPAIAKSARHRVAAIDFGDRRGCRHAGSRNPAKKVSAASAGTRLPSTVAW